MDQLIDKAEFLEATQKGDQNSIVATKAKLRTNPQPAETTGFSGPVKETLKKLPLATQFKRSSATSKTSDGTVAISPKIAPKIAFARSIESTPSQSPIIPKAPIAEQVEKGVKIEIIKSNPRTGIKYFLESKFFKKNILLKNYRML
jgi:hypothetical protein